MGIQIVSLFHDTCTQCNETEDTSVGLYLHLDEKGICSECRQEPIDAEIDDSLTLEDLLLICGHRALGLTEREALEIDESYKYDLMHKYHYR